MLAKKTHSSILQIFPQWKIGSLWNLKLKLMTEKMTTKSFLVKICVYTWAHEAKTCTCIYAGCQNVYTCIYDSCALVFKWNFANIVLIVYYYVKFGHDPSFCCRDICKIMLNIQTRGIIARAQVSMCIRAHIPFMCAGMGTDLYQNLFSGPLLCYELKFQILSKLELKLQKYLQNNNAREGGS